MTATQILIVGTHKEIIKTIGRLIDKNNKWHALLAHNMAEANVFFEQQKVHLVLIGAGLLTTQEQELETLARKYRIPVVSHYGGGSGLLYAEINQALVL